MKQVSKLTDYQQVVYMGLPDISPAAGLAAYTRAAPTEWEYPEEIRIVPVKELLVHPLAEQSGRIPAGADRERKVTAGGTKEYFPRFSPDGKKLAFLSNQEGGATVQIWLAELAERGAGSVKRLTSMQYGVEEFRFSPDGSRLVFTSREAIPSFGGIRPEDLPNGPDSVRLEPETEEERRLRKKEEAKRPIVAEDYGYKSDADKGFMKKSAAHLFTVNPETGEVVRLTGGERDDVMPFFSPDGKWVLFASSRNRPAEESIGMDLFRVPAEGGPAEQLTEDIWIAWYPASFQPLYASDGGFVVIGALEPTLRGGMPATRLYKVVFPDAKGMETLAPETKMPDGKMPNGKVPDGKMPDWKRADIGSDGGWDKEGAVTEPGKPEVCCLWPEDAPCHEATCFLYNGENYGGFAGNAFLSEDNRFVYFISGWHGTSNVYKAATDGAPVITQVTHADGTIRYCKEAGNGKLLLAKGDFTSFAELYLYEEETDTWLQLTDTNPWMRERALSVPQQIWFRTLDGAGRVQGWVIPPQNREKGVRYPAVLYIHGGPTPFYGNALAYEHQLLAGSGIAVLLCNPRGSTGYGPEHSRGESAYDGTAMTDLLQSVEEACRAFDFLDPDRIGVTGGSYGGYMTNWLAGHTKRFAAAVSQRGIANELIQYASSDMAGSSKDYESFQDFMKEGIRKSPVAYADRITIPFLILHGTEDMRCPVEHAHQMYTAVKDSHPELPVRMVLFPGCNHDLPMGGPMKLRTAHYREMIEWFRKYL